MNGNEWIQYTVDPGRRSGGEIQPGKAQLGWGKIVLLAMAIIGIVLANGAELNAQAQPSGQVDAEQEVRLRRAPWYCGFAVYFDTAVPIGDEQFALAPGWQEFTQVFGFGVDLLADISQYIQVGVSFRYGFTGMDAGAFDDPNAFQEDLGIDMRALRAYLWQIGFRLRGFPFDFDHLRPFVSLDFMTTRMGVSKDADEDTCVERLCVEQGETFFSWEYQGTTVAPGLGIRYDLYLGNLGGDPAYADLLMFVLQVSYGFNAFSSISATSVGEGIGTGNPTQIDLDHLWITAGLGYLF